MRTVLATFVAPLFAMSLFISEYQRFADEIGKKADEDEPRSSTSPEQTREG
jgi:hypothetical protein